MALAEADSLWLRLGVSALFAVVGARRRGALGRGKGDMTEGPGMLAAAGIVWMGLGMSVLLGVVGAMYIRTGIRNVRERVAEERGKARLTNAVLGMSNTYEGRKAVALGWVRIIGGAAAVIAAIVMLFVWMSLADR